MTPENKYLLIFLATFSLLLPTTAYTKNAEEKKRFQEFEQPFRNKLAEINASSLKKLDKDIQHIKKLYQDYLSNTSEIDRMIGVQANAKDRSSETSIKHSIYMREINEHAIKSEDLDRKSLIKKQKMGIFKTCMQGYLKYCTDSGIECKDKPEKFCKSLYGYYRTKGDSFRTTNLFRYINLKMQPNYPVEVANVLSDIDMLGDINKADYEKDGYTHLIRAAIYNQTDKIKALIKMGASVDLKAAYKEETALMYATRSNNISSMQALIDAGADVNAINSEGETPLFYVYSNVDALNLLIKHGADINAKNYSGKPSLFNAIYNKKEIINTMLDNNANIETKGPDEQTALLHAIGNKKFDMMETLIKRGADLSAVDKHKFGVVHYAARIRTTDGLGLKFLNFLLKQGANVNAKGFRGTTPLMEAISYNSEDAFDFLIKNGADVNATVESSPRTALPMTNGVTESMALKIINHPSFDASLIYNAQALSMFVRAKMTKALNALIKRGVDINVIDEYKRTALMWAALRGRKAYVKTLLDHGADKNIINKYGNTALSYAEQEEHNDIVSMLKSK